MGRGNTASLELTNRPRRKRRPNASGFAKADCHTCEQDSRICDRLLPKCETCLNEGAVCGGYVVDLKWSEGPVVVTKVKSGTLEEDTNSDAGTSTNSTPPTNLELLSIPIGKEIKFKVGKPRTKRPKFKDHVGREGKGGSKLAVVKNGQSSRAHIHGNELVPVDELQREGCYSPIQMSIGSSRSPSPFRLSPSVEYSNLASRMSGVLEMYDREFCVVHLTTDIALNPFRCRNINAPNSQFLLHAILAMSSLHMARFNDDQQLSLSMLDHKNTSLRLFCEALPNAGRIALTLLDTVLILFSVDAALSALGPWRLHLHGAYNILESSGGIRLLGRLPEIRPKVAVFLWWDVMVCLISRKPMIFPIKYLRPTLCNTAADGWSMFDLHGIPETLFVAMVKITLLHGNPDISQRRSLLREIYDMVQGWINTEEAFGTDHTVHAIDKSDRYHLAETWRCGILLYLSRAFPSYSPASRIANTLSLANSTLGHIRCINGETTIRKQIFLPLFLAGSEVDFSVSRDFCREYCRFFSGSRGYKDLENSCGYGMFANAAELLEEIWAERDVVGDGPWWGDIVDRNTKGFNGLESQFLFG